MLLEPSTGWNSVVAGLSTVTTAVDWRGRSRCSDTDETKPKSPRAGVAGAGDVIPGGG